MNQTMSDIHTMISGNVHTMKLAADVYDLIAAAPEAEQPALFRQACLEFKYTPTDNLSAPCPDLCTPEQLDAHARSRSLLGELYTALNGMGFDEKEFNRQLWHAISSETICKELTLRHAMMFCCARDPRIPYLNVDRQVGSAAQPDHDPVLYGSIAHILQYPGSLSPQQQAGLIAPYLCRIQDEEKMKNVMTMMLRRNDIHPLLEKMSGLDNFEPEDFDPDAFDPDIFDPEVFDSEAFDPEMTAADTPAQEAEAELVHLHYPDR